MYCLCIVYVLFIYLIRAYCERNVSLISRKTDFQKASTTKTNHDFNIKQPSLKLSPVLHFIPKIH